MALHHRSAIGRSLVATQMLMLQTPADASFTALESGHVRPLAISSGGDRLYVVNTPDNQLEVFSLDSFGLTHITSIPVGLEPVAVALRNDNEAWVVNDLSDSICLILPLLEMSAGNDAATVVLHAISAPTDYGR
jgi:YVTN family beta-propeller protein